MARPRKTKGAPADSGASNGNGTSVRDLPVALTPEAIELKKTDLGHAEIELAKLKDDARSAATAARKAIKDQQKIVTTLAKETTSGKTIAKVECVEVHDWPKGKHVVRTDVPPGHKDHVVEQPRAYSPEEFAKQERLQQNPGLPFGSPPPDATVPAEAGEKRLLPGLVLASSNGKSVAP